MRYWFREVFGWGLIGVGIALFYGVYMLAEKKRPCEMLMLALVGVLIFRGGIHLIKVAVAARVCEQAQDRLYPAPAPPPPVPQTRPPAPRDRPAR
jgi:hypothetical protein